MNNVYELLAKHLGFTETNVRNDWVDIKGNHYVLTRLGFKLLNNE